MKHFAKSALFLVLISLVACTHYIYISRCIWQQQAVTIDGRPTEWKLPLKYFDEESKLQYAVSNDFQNIYFCFRATQQETQVKLLRGGMQLWIDTTGQNQHNVGLMFPLSMALRKANPDEVEPPVKGKQDVAGFKNKYLNGYKEMDLAGFKTGINGMSPIKNKAGIEAAINWDTTDILTYEVKIPFRTFYKDSITVHDSLKLFGISFVLNGIPQMERHHESDAGNRQGIPGGAGPGMSAGGGGMRGGGGGHHGGGGRSEGDAGSGYISQSNTIKITFQLSGDKQPKLK